MLPAVVVTTAESFVGLTAMSRSTTLLSEDELSVSWKLTVRVSVEGVSELFS